MFTIETVTKATLKVTKYTSIKPLLLPVCTQMVFITTKDNDDSIKNTVGNDKR